MIMAILTAIIDVTVNISSTTETSFAQLLFPDALVNQVEAVTRVAPTHAVGIRACHRGFEHRGLQW